MEETQDIQSTANKVEAEIVEFEGKAYKISGFDVAFLEVVRKLPTALKMKLVYVSLAEATQFVLSLIHI